MKTLLRRLGWVVAALAALGATALAGALLAVALSLPERNGRSALAGLAHPVEITRDARGMPDIIARDRVDAARALGFLHAQDRFFQMDLLRRRAAGELAALFGRVALPADRGARRHRFRQVARQALAGMPADERRVLDAYVEGANAGLRALRARPFEYFLLRASPAPWTAEDTLLAGAAMWLDLQEDDGEPERSRAAVRTVFSAEAAEFLLSPADPFEAALDGSEIPAPPVPPGPGVPLAVASHDETGAAASPTGLFAALFPPRDPDHAVGSNAWAVGGARSAAGGAVVANDMHLGLRLPHVWYRARIRWTDAAGNEREVVGVTLPGTPPFIVASNGRVAWGFTNAEIDTSDVVVVETDPADGRRYRTPDAWREFGEHDEPLAVRGGETEILRVRTTVWGPVIGRDAAGRPLALRWAAHEPAAHNLRLMAFEEAGSVDEVLALAPAAGIPHQNIVVGDRAGDVGWIIGGRLPRRVGLAGDRPVSWADGTAHWEGWLEPGAVPRIARPSEGFVWTANARVVGGPALALLGDGGYAPAARARRIRDVLREIRAATPAAMLELQLDDRALYLEPWREALLAVLAEDAVAGHAGRAGLRRIVAAWDGRAAGDSAGHRLVREFRRVVRDRVMPAITAPARAVYPEFRYHHLPWERALLQLVAARPPGWLPPGATGWETLLLESADAVVAAAGGPDRLEAFQWGRANVLRMRHPLSAAVPLLGRWLDRPPAALPGDAHVVLAQSGNHGPSQRLAVAPGREDEGILQVPGGQSGHPLSPYYAAGHVEWLLGEPVPLNPGPPVDRLVLAP